MPSYASIQYINAITAGTALLTVRTSKNVWHLAISGLTLTFILPSVTKIGRFSCPIYKCSHTFLILFDKNHPIKSYYHRMPNNGGQNNFTPNGNLTCCHSFEVENDSKSNGHFNKKNSHAFTCTHTILPKHF